MLSSPYASDDVDGITRQSLSRGWRRVAVVTNRFHQFRSGRVFAKAAEQRHPGYFEVVAVADVPLEVEDGVMPPPGAFKARLGELVRAEWNMVRELAAIVLYRHRGWI